MSVVDKDSGYRADVSMKVQTLKDITSEHDAIYKGRCLLYGTVSSENDCHIVDMFRAKGMNFLCGSQELGNNLLDTPNGRFRRLLSMGFKIGTVRCIVSVAL